MAMIYVRARQGRRAYFEGRVIPEDKFIPVTDTPYIRRLINHWEDIEAQDGAPEGQPAEPRRRADRPLSPGRENPPRPRSTVNPTVEE